jgi:hypothetical protein
MRADAGMAPPRPHQLLAAEFGEMEENLHSDTTSLNLHMLRARKTRNTPSPLSSRSNSPVPELRRVDEARLRPDGTPRERAVGVGAMPASMLARAWRVPAGERERECVDELPMRALSPRLWASSPLASGSPLRSPADSPVMKQRRIEHALDARSTTPVSGRSPAASEQALLTPDGEAHGAGERSASSSAGGLSGSVRWSARSISPRTFQPIPTFERADASGRSDAP